ncbi:MAG: IclR family transcriptional regulator [Pseudomonadota bacterium]
MTRMLMEDEKDRSFVTALARGLDVLRAFRRGDVELGNADLAERTGLPKATISRLTHTLVKLDYLVPNPKSGTYRLGAGVLRLGMGVLTGMEMGDRAQGAMRALCDGPNPYVTIALGERHRTSVVYVAVERSTQDVSLSMTVGARLPLFESAMGRAILVAMPEPDREAAFDRADAEEPSGANDRRQRYERAAAEFVDKGYCSGFGEWRPDVNGIAVPVHNLGGARIYGLNVGGPSFHVSKEELETNYAPRLIEASKSLSFA